MKKFTLIFVFLMLSGITIYAQYDCAGNRFKDSLYAVHIDTVQYGSNVDYQGTPVNLTMDVYTPIGDVHTNRPLIIFAPKGSFMDEDNREWVMVQLCQYFAKRGYVTASINYRVGVTYALDMKKPFVNAVVRAVQDYKAAIRYFRKDAATTNTFKVDTNMIIAGGSSAGAITAIHVAYITDINQVVSLCPDTTGFGTLEGNSGNPGYSSKVNYVVGLCGAIADTSWLSNSSIPITTMHGNLDTEVPYSKGYPMNISLIGLYIYGSYLMNIRANHVALSNPFHIFPGKTHIPYDPNAAGNYVQYMDTVLTFVRNQLCNFICGTDLKVENISTIEDIKVFPNPASNFINITSELDNSTLCLYDLTGRLILKQSNLKKSEVKQIDVSSFTKGLYLLKVENEKGQFTSKIVIE